MKIDKKDLFHGAALLQIIEASPYTMIGRIRNRPYYCVTAGNAPRGKENRFLYIKYVSSSREPFRFSFTELERRFLKRELKRPEPVFVALVCGSEFVCVLSRQEFEKLSASAHRMLLQVQTPERGKIRVYNLDVSSKPVLVSYTAYPKVILA
jgi:hypothetical protein